MKYLLLGLVMLAVATTAVANNDRDAVNQTLNALHHNASIADFEQYFGLYHDSAIFIGAALLIWDMLTSKEDNTSTSSAN